MSKPNHPATSGIPTQETLYWHQFPSTEAGCQKEQTIGTTPKMVAGHI